MKSLINKIIEREKIQNKSCEVKTTILTDNRSFIPSELNINKILN